MSGRRRWWRGAGSPGYVGYVLATLVAGVVLGVLWAAPLVAVAGPLGFLVGVLVGVFCAPAVGMPLMLLVHLLCLRARSQRVHVAVTAGLAAGLAALVGADLSGGLLPAWWTAAAVGLAAAAGRACVVALARPGRGDSRDRPRAAPPEAVGAAYVVGALQQRAQPRG